jgi:hypothetical protein
MDVSVLPGSSVNVVSDQAGRDFMHRRWATECGGIPIRKLVTVQIFFLS